MKKSRSDVFEETYRFYLKQLAETDLQFVSDVLGARMEGGAAGLDFFGSAYRVGCDGVANKEGNRPPFDVCIVLLRYILLAPQRPVAEKGWISFRDIPGAAPLINYFSHDVERFLSDAFSGKTNALRKAALELDGNPVDEDLSYDLAMTFQALPKIRLLMLFNDTDPEFTAQCSILFEKGAPHFLDPECLAIMAAYFVRTLNRTGR